MKHLFAFIILLLSSCHPKPSGYLIDDSTGVRVRDTNGILKTDTVATTDTAHGGYSWIRDSIPSGAYERSLRRLRIKDSDIFFRDTLEIQRHIDSVELYIKRYNAADSTLKAKR